jgi:hypothetical protein
MFLSLAKRSSFSCFVIFLLVFKGKTSVTVSRETATL